MVNSRSNPFYQLFQQERCPSRGGRWGGGSPSAVASNEILAQAAAGSSGALTNRTTRRADVLDCFMPVEEERAKSSRQSKRKTGHKPRTLNVVEVIEERKKKKRIQSGKARARPA